MTWHGYGFNLHQWWICNRSLQFKWVLTSNVVNSGAQYDRVFGVDIPTSGGIRREDILLKD